jgi:hypothetical protein
MMPIFTIGNITSEHEDIREARRAAYKAWFESLWEWSGDIDDFPAKSPKPPDLETFRSLAQAELTRRRGEARRPYITDTYGQQLVYMDKERQARDHQADPSPTPTDYPALYGAESAVLGLDAAAMASLILDRARAWRVASDEIEGAVRVAEAGIDAAKMHQEILNILIELDI